MRHREQRAYVEDRKGMIESWLVYVLGPNVTNIVLYVFAFAVGVCTGERILRGRWPLERGK